MVQKYNIVHSKSIVSNDLKMKGGLHSKICKVLSSAETKHLEMMSVQRRYSAGQIIRLEGEPIPFYASVVRGIAKMVKSTHDGRQQIIGLLLPSSLVDDIFSQKAHYSVEAVTDMTLDCYPAQKFVAMIHDTPKLEHRLYQLAMHELDLMHEWMLLLGRKTAQEKVASFLLELARHTLQSNCLPLQSKGAVFEKKEATIEIPVNRSDIADYLGLTMETVCRQMTVLRKNRVINFVDAGKFSVCDLKQLTALADYDDIMTDTQ